MMRKFKHKDTWEIITQTNENWDYMFNAMLANKNYADRHYHFPKRVIENSQDREEVIEQDWIDELIQELEVAKCFQWKYRQAIEKHAPKIKKFTREDVEEFVWWDRPVAYLAIRDFLQKHNLLSSDE